MEADEERSAALIVERLGSVIARGGSLLEAAEEVTTVPRRTPAVLDAAREMASGVDDPAVRGQIRQFLDLLVDTGLLGAADRRRSAG